MLEMPTQLRATELAATIRRLEKRIGERFPGSGLSDIAAELLRVSEDASRRAESFRQPNTPLRGLIGLLLASIGGVLTYTATRLRFVDAAAWEVMEGIEAAISSFVFLGAAVVFLATMESRLNRRRTLSAIQELRELAHIVDMHQLTKDPETAFRTHVQTESSPERPVTPFLLGRYLDYCTELLSLIGKVAVFYVHGVNDSAILAAVDNVEALTTGLSRKIWQKIMILNSLDGIDHDPSGR